MNVYIASTDCVWLGLHLLFLLNGVIIKVFSLVLDWVGFKVKTWNKVKNWEITSGTIV